MKILVTGVSGKLGRMVAAHLASAGHEVIGVDRRPWPDAPEGVDVYCEDIRKRPAEDIFRRRRPEAVVHMGTVTFLTDVTEDRYRINLGGTRAVFDYSARYGVRQAIFLGRHTYYGAVGDASLYRHETDPPLAVSTFPELADLVAADLYAVSMLWSAPGLDTVVMRMCYTLGPSRHGTLAAFLSADRVPTVLGFDPLFQFIQDQDAVAAICTALDARLRGVFNVAGPPPVPLSTLIDVLGKTRVPLPETMLRATLGQFGLPELPPGALSHVKYPVLVDDSPFRSATGFTPAFDEAQTMESFRYS